MSVPTPDEWKEMADAVLAAGVDCRKQKGETWFTMEIYSATWPELCRFARLVLRHEGEIEDAGVKSK